MILKQWCQKGPPSAQNGWQLLTNLGGNYHRENNNSEETSNVLTQREL